jgi:hypothetical protein
LVYNDKAVVAYERKPFSVVGDGKSTIGELANAKVALLKEQGKLRKNFDADDITICKVLHRERLYKDEIRATASSSNYWTTRV